MVSLSLGHFKMKKGSLNVPSAQAAESPGHSARGGWFWGRILRFERGSFLSFTAAHAGGGGRKRGGCQCGVVLAGVRWPCVTSPLFSQAESVFALAPFPVSEARSVACLIGTEALRLSSRAVPRVGTVTASHQQPPQFPSPVSLSQGDTVAVGRYRAWAGGEGNLDTGNLCPQSWGVTRSGQQESGVGSVRITPGWGYEGHPVPALPARGGLLLPALPIPSPGKARRELPARFSGRRQVPGAGTAPGRD